MWTDHKVTGKNCLFVGKKLVTIFEYFGYYFFGQQFNKKIKLNFVNQLKMRNFFIPGLAYFERKIPFLRRQILKNIFTLYVWYTVDTFFVAMTRIFVRYSAVGTKMTSTELIAFLPRFWPFLIFIHICPLYSRNWPVFNYLTFCL